jgi:thymidylate synthase ThyX
MGDEQGDDWLRLVDYDPQGELKVLAAALFRYGNLTWEQAYSAVKATDEAARLRLVETLLSHLGKHDIPLRELEHTTYTFELVVDQGAFFEIKRHRMMTQSPQALTTRLGYAVPRQISIAGFEVDYCQAMDQAAAAYEQLAQEDPYLASYVVPNGYNRRALLTLNLREAYHFCGLRSASNAHFSVRRAALRMAQEIRQVHPALAAYIDLPTGETWETVEKGFFSQVMAGNAS